MVNKVKEAAVQTLSDKIKSNSSVLLTEYHGLTVAEITELRSKLRPAKCEYKVVKNTLSKKALKGLKLDSFGDLFTGPSALALNQGDPVLAAKILVDFSKEHAKLKLKAGLLGTKLLSEKEVRALASLPPRDVLLGQLLRTLNGPIQNFVNVLQANPRGLVTVLDAIRKQKEKAA